MNIVLETREESMPCKPISIRLAGHSDIKYHPLRID